MTDCYIADNSGQWQQAVDNVNTLYSRFGDMIDAAGAAKAAADAITNNMSNITTMIKAQIFNQAIQQYAVQIQTISSMINAVLSNNQQIKMMDSCQNVDQLQWYEQNYTGVQRFLATIHADDSGWSYSTTTYDAYTNVPYCQVTSCNVVIPDDVTVKGTLDVTIEIQGAMFHILGWIADLFNTQFNVAETLTYDENIKTQLGGNSGRNMADLRSVWGWKSYDNQGNQATMNDCWLTDQLSVVLPQWMSNTHIIH